MRKFFTYSILILITLYGINILTLSIFGKTTLTNKILEDTHISYKKYQWTEDVNIASDLELNEKQINLIEELYNNTKADFKYRKIIEFDEVGDLFSSDDKYLHLMLVNRHFGYPIYKVAESEKIGEYYHGYRRTYVWLFVVWVQIDLEFIGIT